MCASHHKFEASDGAVTRSRGREEDSCAPQPPGPVAELRDMRMAECVGRPAAWNVAAQGLRQVRQFGAVRSGAVAYQARDPIEALTPPASGTGGREQALG